MIFLAVEAKDSEAFSQHNNLKRHSPFARFFRDAVVQIGTIEDDTLNPSTNTFYSPTAFRVIDSVMHLFPLWYAAMQGDVLQVEFKLNRTSTRCQKCNI